MEDNGMPGPIRKYVSPLTQAKREAAALKRAVREEIKLHKAKRKVENLRSLLKDIEDAKADRINSFDIEKALRDTSIVSGMLTADRFNR